MFSVSDHFITTADGFYILKDRKDGIEDHLEESIKFLIESYYKGASPPQLKTMYHKGDEGWSTSGSDLGCGDRGQRMLTVAEEVWSGSMMFQKGSKPKSGTKFKVTHIVNNKGVSCIVQMGFLSAPSSSEYLGSLSTEVHTVLGSTNKTRLQIDYCDQSLKLGPV